MVSIRQNAYPDLLPDFRNMGVIARVLLAVNAAAIVGAFYATSTLPRAPEHFVQAAAFIEPLLLAELIALFALSPWLARLPYPAGCVAVIVVVAALAGGYHAAASRVALEAPPSIPRTIVLAAALAGSLLLYFRLYTKAFSPALAEARLQALQARIRPHFLFNSL